jgi:hypothetical protein
MNFVNLTPHPITVKTNEIKRTFEPSGQVARVETTETLLHTVEGIPIMKRTWEQPTGIPDPEEGTLYIVSSVVLSAAAERTDLISPDTGKTAERNEKGHILSVIRFVTE